MSFFTKSELSRREARRLEVLCNFGIFPITLKPGKIHVLGDTFLRAPHASVNVLQVINIDLDDKTYVYEDDNFYEPELKMMRGAEISNEMLRKIIKKLLPLCNLDDKRILYK